MDLVIEANAAARESLKETATYAPLLRLYLFFLLMFQTIFRLSDNALDVLLKFLSMFFKTLGKVSQLPEHFVQSLPSSIYSARKVSGSDNGQFDRYVSCPDCHCLYKLEDCIVKLCDGQLDSKKCSFVHFPAHTQVQHRKPCDTRLMKKVKRKAKALSLYPRRVYCYKSLINSLQDNYVEAERFLW